MNGQSPEKKGQIPFSTAVQKSITQIYAEDFERFWQRYPLKVGKLAAAKAYVRVRKTGTTHMDLLTGLLNYIVTKPDYQNYCHPTTWLNQGRWLDEGAPLTAGELNFAKTVMRKRLGKCLHDPPCHNSMACLNAIAYEVRQQRKD
jgi:hypothetical protein